MWTTLSINLKTLADQKMSPVGYISLANKTKAWLDSIWKEKK